MKCIMFKITISRIGSSKKGHSDRKFDIELPEEVETAIDELLSKTRITVDNSIPCISPSNPNAGPDVRPHKEGDSFPQFFVG